ncbi:small, acid-soluble spore protein L [Cytobacillus sp. Hm23]
MEVKLLTKQSKTRGRVSSGVNPQGYGQDSAANNFPKSKLENAAKMKNTK